MVQQVIDIGTAPNDRTGDTWRLAMEKTNSNFTELYGFFNTQNFTFVSSEADFPVQDPTTITLEANTIYVLAANITTAKQFVCQNGARITASNPFSFKLSYSGSSSMFLGSSVDFSVENIVLDSPLANTFDFSSVSQANSFICQNVTIEQCAKLGNFLDMGLIQFLNVGIGSAGNGITLAGTNTRTFILDQMSISSSSGTFVGVNLDTVVVNALSFSKMFMSAPAGGIGISGLASSGNIPTLELATVRDCTFSGGMTDLQNITNVDIRWVFRDCFPTSDTFGDAMLTLKGNALVTTITTINTPVKANGGTAWNIERSSLFTGDNTGRITYIAERDLVVPIDVTISAEPDAGSNQVLQFYVALNGVVIPNSVQRNRIDNNDPRNTGLIWQQKFAQNDFIEIFVENTTSTNDIIVSDVTFRVR